MNLPRESLSFLAWLAMALRTFMAVRPVSTIVVISSSGIARISSLLAFLLPLKVILLAGSEGVPRYFPFIAPELKLHWIIGLAIGAFVCYALTLLLDAVSLKLSENASSDVMQGANDAVIFSDQDQIGRRYYAAFCQIASNLLFVLLGVLVLAILTPALAVFLASMCLLQYLIVAYVMRGNPQAPGAMRRMIEGRLGTFLKILSSINFLGGFVVLLAPFLLGQGANILIAILALVILRQSLNSLSSIIGSSAQLSSEKYRIDALIFREAQLHQPENQTSRTLREVFDKGSRETRAGELLARAGITGTTDVHWMDPATPSIKTFVISVTPSESGAAQHFQQRIYPKQSLQLLEHESFLFRHVSRRLLHAPEPLFRYTEGDFECVILPYGNGRPLDAREWKEWRPRLLARSWLHQPPDSLVLAYANSRPLLHQRLNDDLLGRLRIAVDTDEERQALDALHERLPDIRTILQQAPLYILNPDLSARNTVVIPDEDAMAMHWGRWSLAPLGGTTLDMAEMTMLIDLLPQLHEQRNDLPAGYGADDIRFARRCHALEAHVNSEQYKAALRTVEEILANPLLHVATAQHKLSSA